MFCSSGCAIQARPGSFLNTSSGPSVMRVSGVAHRRTDRVAAALEKEVVLLVADRQDTELGEARVRVDHNAVGSKELAPLAEAVDEAARARVAERHVQDARVFGEELEVLARPDEADACFRESGALPNP